MRGLVVAAVMASGTAVGAQDLPELTLDCPGTATIENTIDSSEQVTDSKGKTKTKQIQTTVPEQVPATMQVVIAPAGSRIFVPREMRNPFMSKGDGGGWYPLNNVAANPDSISAKFSTGLFNKPRVTIDRRSGAISVSGMDGFRFAGSCSKSDPNAPAKF